MKKLSLILTLSLLPFGFNALAQEDCADGVDNDGDGMIDLNDPDCDCAGIGGTVTTASMIPNPSFEDYTCCPTGFSQLSCAVDWIQASPATSDYWNECGYSTTTLWCDAFTPAPDGTGWAGFINGYQYDATYNEMIGACLTGPMTAGTPYVLNMWIAWADGNPDITLTIYGTPNCADLPWTGYLCPIGSGAWEELANTYVTFTTCGDWVNVTLNFTPTVDINAIAIGGPCGATTTPAGETYNYYYVDDLTIIDSVAFAGGNITETGNWCDSDLMLTSTIDTVGWTCQWYQDGIALPGETAETIDIMPYGAGVFSIVYTVGADCDESSYTIVLPADPNADFTWNDQCEDVGAVTFTDASTITTGTISSWAWDFDDAGATSTAPSPTYNFSGPGTYNVSLTVSTAGGCTNTITYPVTIYPDPVSDFTFSINGVSSTTGITGGCLGDPVVFTNNSTIGVPDNITITNWDFGDGSTSGVSDPTYTFAADGTYIVELAVESNNGCQDTIQIPIDVYPIPLADFTVAPVCQNVDAVFTNTSTITSGTITGFEWNFDDGSPINFTAGPINHSYVSGTYNPSLVVISDQGCSDTVSYPLDVYAIPTAEFTTSDVCNGETSFFTDASTVGTGTIASWSYDFDDGTPLDPTTSPTHVYALTGTYNVTLTVTSDNGCTDDTTIVHNVSSTPVANFTTSDVCQDVSATFTDASTVSGGALTNWEWDFNDGSPFDLTAGPVSHPYAAPGTYNVTLVVQAGSVACSDTITLPVTIHPMPTADFTTADVCQDVAAAFTDNSSIIGGAISNWNWNFDDGNISALPSPSNPYASDGTYNVTLTVTSDQGCVDAITLPITIHPIPIADFSSSTICENEGPTTFTNESSISSGSYTSVWDFGDSGTGTTTNPTHAYVGYGTYNATLTITSTFGCTATVTSPVNVLEVPVAAFTSDPPIICSPDCIQFFDNSTGVSPITSWAWDFGNGGIQTGQNPVPCYQHQSDYTEYYDVNLTVTNAAGCSNATSVIDYVAVEATPIAEFLFNPTLLTIEDTRVNFTNKSTAADNYLWDFGDGSPNSTMTDPEHTFPEIAGEYIVRLDAYSASGACHDYTVKLIVIDDVIIFYVPNVFTPDGDDYNETFQPVFFSGFDPYDFHMTIFNRWGEIVFETFDAKRGWPGTYGDIGLVEDGVYIWQIEFKETMSDKKHKHRGHVTILK